MTQVKDMRQLERKVFEACYNGWYLSSQYKAVFFGHERLFEADSIRLLAREVEKWFASHAEHHGNDILLVKYHKAI